MTASAAPAPAPLPFVRKASLNPTFCLDSRTAAWRADLAHVDLMGQVGAQHFVTPVRAQGQADVTGLFVRCDPASEQVSQLLAGEGFDVLEAGPVWSWGQSVRDGYVGYIATDALDFAAAVQPSHWVCAPAAHVFSQPDIKSAPLGVRYLGSPVALSAADGSFQALAGGGYLHLTSVRPIGDWLQDWTAAAAQMIGTPYLWGGRSRAGIDCSGLVQVALQACGMSPPRDCDLQAVALGQDAGVSPLQRGDLIYFPGHVGIMADGHQLLHATAAHMTTLLEPLANVVARVAASHATPITAVRRLAPRCVGVPVA